MDRNKKIWLGISLTAVAVGGFFLTKYLTRNTKHYKFGTIKGFETEEKPVSIDDI